MYVLYVLAAQAEKAEIEAKTVSLATCVSECYETPSSTNGCVRTLRKCGNWRRHRIRSSSCPIGNVGEREIGTQPTPNVLISGHTHHRAYISAGLSWAKCGGFLMSAFPSHLFLAFFFLS